MLTDKPRSEMGLGITTEIGKMTTNTATIKKENTRRISTKKERKITNKKRGKISRVFCYSASWFYLSIDPKTFCANPFSASFSLIPFFTLL